MSKRGYVTVIAMVVVMTIGARLLGEWFRVAVFVALGLLGLVATIRYERVKSRITDFLSEQPPEEQDAILVWDEAWEDRPEILARLGRQGPRVPLRGGREVFAYAPHHVTAAFWSMIVGAALTAFAAGMAIFAPPNDPSEWPYLIALLIGFGAMTAFMPWQIRIARGRIEVTEEAIASLAPDGARTAWSWSEIVSAKTSWLGSSLVLRTLGGRRIWIGHSIDGYGRLANLIATRIPEGVVWRVA
jgi:hypothetical protein